jgi:hypothetical protein
MISKQIWQFTLLNGTQDNICCLLNISFGRLHIRQIFLYVCASEPTRRGTKKAKNNEVTAILKMPRLWTAKIPLGGYTKPSEEH